MKKHKLLLFFILTLTLQGICRIKVDSLWNVLKHEKEDTAKVSTLNLMAKMYCQHAVYPKADSLAKAALELSQKCNFDKGILIAYSNLGEVNFQLGNFDQGIKFHILSLKKSEEINDKLGIRNAYSGIGNIYRVQANYYEALKCFLTCLKNDTVMMWKPETAGDYGNIGIIYNEEGHYPLALSYFLKSLKIRESIKDKHGIASCYGNIGNVYSMLNENDDALKYFQLCLSLSEQLSDKLSISNCYSSIAGIYSSTGKLNQALDYNLKCLTLDKEMDNKDALTSDYYNLSSVYMNMGKYNEAISNCKMCIDLSRETGGLRMKSCAFNSMEMILFKEKKYAQAKPFGDSALAIAKTLGSKSLLSDVLLSYSSLDSALGNYAGAFNTFKTFIVYRDSINSEANTKKMVQEQMNYEFEKKEAITKAEQDKKDTVVIADKRRQQIITGSVSLGLLLVLVFSFLLFSRYRVAQKQKKIIEEQKQLVEEKNKEVLDSITYAKRLQDAILPPLSLIGQYLPDSLILYKPKDIVAGDFYWVQPLPDTILVAACDCTGHGVPGAMVSVVCSNALNRAVKEFKITEPGKILDKTRELVMETFEKSEGEIKDGMDISLAAISYKPAADGSIKVLWSGAYNPLWYIHSGEIKEVTGDKQPIGKHVTQQPFSTHTLQLNRGDSLYLFTDGYADQFGGPKGKKFKYKQFQELITANVSKPLLEQKKLLDSAFENWRIDMEQTDDVCVIGIRI